MSDRDPLGGVGAVVVNHDAGDALLSCVASLRAAGIEEIVVVDNASEDGSLARLAERDRRALLVPTGANLGYGRGANRGAQRLSNEYLVVSNPDLVVDPDAVKILVDELESHPEAAVAAPRLLDASGVIYPSARAFPDALDAVGHAFVGLFRPDNPFSRRYRLEAADLDERREVDWVSGAFLVLRRVAFDSVDGFDEGYFMYVEDLDLCWRLHRAGWSVRYVPDAAVVHSQGLSAARHPGAMLIAHHRSAWRFARRRASGSERLVLPAIGAGLLLRLALALGRELAAKASRSRNLRE
jgi:N-acetylglucosaminyl-diphospho-decaprenol L-rhamnosyltransferase